MEIALISTTCIRIPLEDYAGSERMCQYIAEGLRDRGHNVTLVAPKGSYLEGINVIETIPPTYSGLKGERKAFEIWKDKIPKDADIYDDHSHFCVSSVLNLQNHIWSCHDLLPLRKAPNVDLILARSKFHAEYLRKAWGGSSIDFVYNGVNVDHYQFNEEKLDYALFLGRMAKSKGPLSFLEICKRTGMRGCLAGEDSPRRGVEQSTVWKLIKECNENDDLTFLGRVPEWRKVELLRDARAYISPLTGNYLAVFDLTQVESLAAGTPVFITDQGAPREIIGGIGKTDCGYVAEDVSELTEAVCAFGEGEFNFSPEECRKRAEDFNIEHMVGRYEKVYKEIAED